VPVTLDGSTLKMEHKADPGESGAPLLDADGKVVALVTSGNQCIPVQFARKLIP
jgi:V8-like Glu-specific endopeptidase